jgi:predicted molibdopterin-dependent oxidoreductase YjgC
MMGAGSNNLLPLRHNQQQALPHVRGRSRAEAASAGMHRQAAADMKVNVAKGAAGAQDHLRDAGRPWIYPRPGVQSMMEQYSAEASRFPEARRRQQEVKDDNPMYIRDYAKCLLCWRCVQVCADDAQYTFAINFNGRGFETEIGTFFDKPIRDRVLCGQCVGVCPTGALKASGNSCGAGHESARNHCAQQRHEEAQRQAELIRARCGGEQPEQGDTDMLQAERVVPTTCPYCGVGCQVHLHVRDDTIYRVSGLFASPVNHGNLCVKGRFGTILWTHPIG